MDFKEWAIAFVKQQIKTSNLKSDARAKFERTLDLMEKFDTVGPYPLMPERLDLDEVKALPKSKQLAALEADRETQNQYYEACESWRARAEGV